MRPHDRHCSLTRPCRTAGRPAGRGTNHPTTTPGSLEDNPRSSASDASSASAGGASAGEGSQPLPRWGAHAARGSNHPTAPPSPLPLQVCFAGVLLVEAGELVKTCTLLRLRYHSPPQSNPCALLRNSVTSASHRSGAHLPHYYYCGAPCGAPGGASGAPGTVVPSAAAVVTVVCGCNCSLRPPLGFLGVRRARRELAPMQHQLGFSARTSQLAARSALHAPLCQL